MRCEEGTLASPRQVGQGVHRHRTRATQASPPLPTQPPPLRVRSRFPGDIMKYLPLKAGAVWMWGGDALCCASPLSHESSSSSQGDASVPTPRIIHTRPYGKTVFFLLNLTPIVHRYA